MKILYSLPLFLISALLVACSGGTLWSHPSKSLNDLHVNDKECVEIALAKAKSQSLVDQPNIYVINSAYFQCMQGYGWVPSNKEQTDKTTVSSEPSIRVEQTDGSIVVSSPQLHVQLTGESTSISHDQTSASFQLDDQYIYLYLQHITGLTIERIYPALSPRMHLFSKRKTANSKAAYYYQQINGESVFGCIAYIWPQKNSRIIVSFTKVVPDIPEDFMQTDRTNFAELEQLEKRWTGMLADIEQQNSGLFF